MEPDTGDVRVASSLIDKGGSKFTLQVSASDGSKVSSDNAVVDVRIIACFKAFFN